MLPHGRQRGFADHSGDVILKGCPGGSDMKAAVIKSVGAVGIETMPDPTPGPGEVVVQVAACGLCGTDLHILQGEFAPTLPIVPGHEFSGTVVGCGTEVRDVQEG